MKKLFLLLTVLTFGFIQTNAQFNPTLVKSDDVVNYQTNPTESDTVFLSTQRVTIDYGSKTARTETLHLIMVGDDTLEVFDSNTETTDISWAFSNPVYAPILNGLYQGITGLTVINANSSTPEKPNGLYDNQGWAIEPQGDKIIIGQ